MAWLLNTDWPESMAWLPSIDDLDDVALVALAAGLVTMAGLMSGLTLGLMSLDRVEMEVLRRTGTAREKSLAARIAPILRNQHRLLVTLLLCNAVASEALPLVIDRLADPVTAVIISVTVVLFFGEIIPQAACSKYGLEVGAYSAWFVRLLMALTSPVAWPLAKLLDLVLGTDHTVLFRRTQLKELMSLHREMGSMLTEEEVQVICGALDLTSKTARQVMTPLHKVFMLSSDARLDRPTLLAIVRSGHSRIPIYRGGDRQDILGLLLVKELIRYRSRGAVAVADIMMRSLPRFPATTPLYDLLKLFETGRTHMVVLTEQPRASSGGQPASAQGQQQQAGGDAAPASAVQPAPASPSVVFSSFQTSAMVHAGPVVGILTIEDIIEELIQVEIVDETDRYVDNEQRVRVDTAKLLSGLPQELQAALASRGAAQQQQGASLMDLSSPFFSARPAGTRARAQGPAMRRQATAPAAALLQQAAGLEQQQQQQQQASLAKQTSMPASPRARHSATAGVAAATRTAPMEALPPQHTV